MDEPAELADEAVEGLELEGVAVVGVGVVVAELELVVLLDVVLLLVVVLLLLPPLPPGQKVTTKLVPEGHAWVLVSSDGYWYASLQPSSRQVSAEHEPEPVLLVGVMEMAVLKPTVPVSVSQALRLVHEPEPGGMMLMSYQGLPESESTENSASVADELTPLRKRPTKPLANVRVTVAPAAMDVVALLSYRLTVSEHEFWIVTVVEA